MSTCVNKILFYYSHITQKYWNNISGRIKIIMTVKSDTLDTIHSQKTHLRAKVTATDKERSAKKKKKKTHRINTADCIIY